VQRALYTNGCVFSDSSSFPVSAAHALWLAEEKNSLRDWDASKWHAMDATEENVRVMLAEKDDAVREVQAMRGALASPPAALDPEALRDLEARFDIFHRYVRGFRAIGRAIALSRYVAANPDATGAFALEARAALPDALAELLALAREFRTFRDATDHRYSVYLLLGWERLEALHDDLARLASAAPGPARAGTA
jgi:hypothetical protein